MTTLPEDVSDDMRLAIDELESAVVDMESRLESTRAERDEAKARQVELEIENANLRRELGLARERQKASTDILDAISESAGDADRALQRIAEITAKLFSAPSVSIRIAKGEEWGKSIVYGASAQRIRAEVPAAQRALSADNLPGSVYRENRQIHIPDLDNVDPAMARWPMMAARAEGTRTVAGTPLRREGKAIGALIVFRDRLAPFTDEELTLQQSFADQAVIAIENARLFNETREALEQQKASSDILRVISSSVADTQPVFDKILDSCSHLFGSDETAVLLVDDENMVTLGAYVGRQHDAVAATFPAPLEKSPAGRAIRERGVVHYADAANDPLLTRAVRQVAQLAGYEAMAYAPMLWNERGIGAIGVSRRKGGFSDKELSLLQTFADQAVIAIQNARLFNETREALERQTATADILNVIASSPSDVKPVFEAIVGSAKRLLSGHGCGLYRIVDGMLHLVAFTPLNPEADEILRNSFPVPSSEYPQLVLVKRGESFQFADTEKDAPEIQTRVARARGFRSVLLTPLIHNGTTTGLVVVTRAETGSFADHHVRLMKAFADQAVIAIENTRLFNETQEALERQTATADILKVIASSPSDTAPVFDAIATSANRLLAGFSTAVFRFVDGIVHIAAFTPTNPAADEALRADFPVPVEEFEAFRLAQHGKPFPIPDTEEMSHAPVRETARLHGFRSMLYVPLMSSGVPLGIIAVTRVEPGTFAPHHVQLLQTFADQAVIAIENTRLFNETKEALERQTATADILKVIASSPSDAQPVFDAIATSAKRLIGGFSAAVFRFVDGLTHLTAFTPTTPAADEVFRATFPRPVEEFDPFQLAKFGRPVPIPDIEDITNAYIKEVARARGFRSMLFVPLMNAGLPIGLISVTRIETGPFAPNHIELLQTFADQAVIAIENTRLFNEVQERTDELSEALGQQTATADVLKVISRSAFDLQTVLDTLTKSAAHLCNADMAAIARKDERGFYHATNYNFAVDWVKFTDTFRLQPGRESVIGRALLANAAVQIPDVLADPEYAFPDMQKAAGYRTLLGVPMLRGTEPVGVLFLGRNTVEPFTERQIELVQTFADQAVIAIENVRLFDEVQAKTRDLEEALTYQTGSSNILRVIASSPTDIKPVLQAIVESACELCGAYDAVLRLRNGDMLEIGAHHGTVPADWNLAQINPHWTAGRAALERRPVHVHDMSSSEGDEFPQAQARALDQGHRTILSVPLLQEASSIGTLTLRRFEVNPFSDKQIALLQTFADQAVIAIGNVRLFEEVQAKTRDLTEALTYQTGSANILRVIASSPTDVAPVLDAVVKSACELCDAYDAIVRLKDGDYIRFGAHHGPIPPVLDERLAIERSFVTGRAIVDRQTIHLHDLSSAEGDEFPGARQMSLRYGIRTILCAPLLRESESVGVILLRRTEVNPFTDKQIALLQTFADQAAIAIGNVRLFEEVQAKTRDLQEALTYQTGSANILRVIASSPTDVKPVLQSIVESACELCGANDAMVRLRNGDMLEFSAHHGPIPVTQLSLPIDRDGPAGLAVLDQKPVHVHDVLSAEGDRFPDSQERARRFGHRTVLNVPLLREGKSIGVLIIRRTEVNPFTDKQIALLQTFSDQAVIAIGNVRLFEEVQAKTRDLSEALRYQTGSANILNVIASSPTDVQPVLKAIVESACELCDAHDAVVLLRDGDHLCFSEHHGPISINVDKWPISRGWAAGRAFIDQTTVHVPDVRAEEASDFTDSRELTRRAGSKGVRSILAVPLLRESESVGAILLRREEVRPFNDKQIGLLQTFADQAVIAIGNVRLFEEVQAKTRDLSEALEFQTATGDVLNVISRSPNNLQPVMDTIVQTAQRLCNSEYALILHRRDDGFYGIVGHANASPELLSWMHDNPVAAGDGSAVGIVAVEKKTLHLHDSLADPRFTDLRRQQVSRARTMLAVPLLREDEVIGVVFLARTEVQPFTERQVDLITSFADQAVIAISNVNLFEEVQARTRDLTESLQQQTATAEVLKVISRSAFDLQTVLETLIKSAVELSGAYRGSIFLREGDVFPLKAASSTTPEFLQYWAANPPRAGRGSATSRVILSGKVEIIPDIQEDAEIQMPASSLARIRGTLGVPMLRDNKVEGVLVLTRPEPGPFTASQIALVQTFADQAVIAVENVRLFDEVKQRTEDLSESLQQQTATADVLKVISRSAFDLQTVLDTLVESAARLCDADRACVFKKSGELFYWVSNYGFSEELIAYANTHPFAAGTHSTTARVALEGKAVHNPDVLADPNYKASEYQRLGNYRTMLGIPLLREGAPIGVFILAREQVRPFSNRQIDLVTSFADQAVIAIENVRLFDEVQARTKELAASLDDLRTAQDRLVQTEKLASLGQLTAGIAHEIKNPLNFVNNFASLSAELTGELNDVLKQVEIDDKLRAEVDELTGLLKDNLEKVVQHGKRADSIVKNMLLHSREGGGEHRPSDINALIDESLNLAYHGARAEKPDFNVTLQRDFDQDAGQVDLFPQEITRVLLNLVSNGFYAVTKRRKEGGEAGFEPTLRASTKSLGESVEIRIRDNGIGIPAEVKEKMFNPFFTTKPAGEGTGLGLSMSHDIIVKQHGGTIDVDTSPGHFTEFRIVLPRTSNLTDKFRG